MIDPIVFVPPINLHVILRSIFLEGIHFYLRREMGCFVRLSLSAAFTLVFVSLINANSLPINGTSVVSISAVPSETASKIANCQNDADCGHGKCSNSTCECSNGWIPYGNVAEKTGSCNYDQRSKRTAFFTSFFAGPFGADWFYLSRSNLAYIITGVLKLLIECGSIAAWLISFFGSEYPIFETNKTKFRRIKTFLALISFVWWIVDWSRILGNRFPDGNGVALSSW